MEGTMQGQTTDFDEYVAGLRQIQDQEHARLADLLREVEKVRTKVGRIDKAIKALSGGSPKPQAKPDGRIKSGRYRGNRTAVSEKTLDRVRGVVHDAGNEGVTHGEVMERAEISHDTATRAIQNLREKDEIRLAGKRPDNRKNVYKVMP